MLQETHNNYYWTKETDEKIQAYNNCSSSIERNRIYEEHLHTPISKMVECIFFSFTFAYCNETSRDLQNETIAHIVSKLHKFDGEKGNSFGYFSVAARWYLVAKSKNGYEETKRMVCLDDHGANEDGEYDDISNQIPQLSVDPFSDLEEKEFAKLAIEWFDANIDQYCTGPACNSLAKKFIELYKQDNHDSLFFRHSMRIHAHTLTEHFNDRNIYEHTVNKVRKKMQHILKALRAEYIQTGNIEIRKQSKQSKQTIHKRTIAVNNDNVKHVSITEITESKPLSENDKIEIKCRYNEDYTSMLELCEQFNIRPVEVINIAIQETVLTEYRMDEQKAKSIREQYASGNISENQLAEQFDVRQSTINRILRGETWKHCLPSDYSIPEATHFGEFSGSMNNRAKLNETIVKDILQKHTNGIKNKELSNLYAVDVSTVRRIVNGEAWKHVSMVT